MSDNPKGRDVQFTYRDPATGERKEYRPSLTMGPWAGFPAPGVSAPGRARFLSNEYRNAVTDMVDDITKHSYALCRDSRVVFDDALFDVIVLVSSKLHRFRGATGPSQTSLFTGAT